MTKLIRNKPFSMIREFQLADWFTLANAVCGTGALFSMLTYLQTYEVTHVYFASGMVVAALVFDVLDGRIARWRQKNSVMGRELDSLADVISFGVAPAVIAYGCGMQGLYDRIILTCFVALHAAAIGNYGRGDTEGDDISQGARVSRPDPHPPPPSRDCRHPGV